MHLDDDRSNQAVAQKLVMDGLLPVSTFEKNDYHDAIFIEVLPVIVNGVMSSIDSNKSRTFR